MVNQIAPFGIQDLTRREGASPMFGLSRAFISSSDPTPIFSGDLVQDLPTAPASGNFGPYLTQASSGLSTANAAFKGIFRGCEFLNLAVGRVLWSPFWPGASVGGPSSQADPVAYFAADPDMQFIAQATSAAIIGSSNVGQNITVTRRSATPSADSRLLRWRRLSLRHPRLYRRSASSISTRTMRRRAAL